MLVTSTDRPCRDISSSTASMTSAKNGSEMDSTTNPIVVSVPARRDRAIASGSNRRSSIAAWTRCRVTGATRGSSFRTREAVRRLTPAAFATSRSLVGPLTGLLLGRVLLGRVLLERVLCHRWHTVIVPCFAIDGKARWRVKGLVCVVDRGSAVDWGVLSRTRSTT